jgi:anaerobic sulfite reductase subunit B
MSNALAETRVPRSGGFVPDLYRVTERRAEAPDVVTVSLEPIEEVDADSVRFVAGQFNMLTVFGIGEAAISISNAPGDGGTLDHTVRDVGAVTHALCSARVGSVVGVRGPFGTGWGVEELAAGSDVVVVAGGIGLAPLRGAVRLLAGSMLSGRNESSADGTDSGGDRGGRLAVLVGARSPDQVVFGEDIERWREAGAEVEVTVDVADPSWSGNVGVVTTLLSGRRFDPFRTTALVCGPEVMMRFTARALLDKGIRPSSIRLSLERNMQCGIGLCGHCQLGPLLLCRDGPVVVYDGPLPRLMSEHEL